MFSLFDHVYNIGEFSALFNKSNIIKNIMKAVMGQLKIKGQSQSYYCDYKPKLYSYERLKNSRPFLKQFYDVTKNLQRSFDEVSRTKK